MNDDKWIPLSKSEDEIEYDEMVKWLSDYLKNPYNFVQHKLLEEELNE